MSSILQDLAGQIGGAEMGKLAEAVGADRGSVEKAVAAALPVLMGAFAHEASDTQGASSLLGALDRDHDGSVLDDIGGFFAGGSTSDGSAILGHVLGGSQPRAEQTVSKVSGLDMRQVTSLMAMLAPIVMGYLGRMRRQHDLDTAGLAQQLGREREVLNQAQPNAMDVIGGLLDQDRDGDFADDLAAIGGSLLSKFMKG
jgi:hypothetical protein